MADLRYTVRPFEPRVIEGGTTEGAVEAGVGERRSVAATPFVWRDPATIPRRAWVYGHQLIRKFASATVAPGGVGKSSLKIVEALAMATGRPLLGITPPKRLRVWLWNGEDPREELERRVMAACLHYGIGPRDLDGWLFLDSGRDSEVVLAHSTKTGTQLALPVFDELIATITANAIDVVMLDPFVSTHAVSENDNTAIDMVVKGINRIADQTNTAFDLVHHVRKGQGGNGEYTVEDGRGASALLAAVRSARVLNAMSKEEAERAGVEEPRLHFRADNGKANLAPPEKTSWFRLVSVSLGNDLDGPSDHVAVVEPWSWPDPLADVTVSDLRRAQTAVAAGQWREDVRAQDWVGKPIAAALGIALDGPGKAKVSALLKTWIRTGMFVAVQRNDGQRKLKNFIEVGEPATD